MRTCRVFYKDKFAGYLIKTNDGLYLFIYDSQYLNSKDACALSLSLPLQKEAFVSPRLFPFFEGLLSEGWLRKIQSVAQKIDEMDSFGLLEENGLDLIGAVSIRRLKD